jgi:hypothetical protein
LYIFLYRCVYFFIFLKTKGKHTHRGEVLQIAVKKTRTKITQLVKRMGISRGTFYNHRDDPNLSFEDLERYGKVMGYDFTNDFPEMQKYVVEEPVAPYGEPKTFDEAIKQRDYWRNQTDIFKNKYLESLEKYNRLIEEGMEKKG